MKKTFIYAAVTNDLSQDQRMRRICNSLQKEYELTLIGRKKTRSLPLINRKFKQKRLACIFQSGKLFYLEYNIRLFFYLISQPKGVYNAIDLDTILPMMLVAKLKNAKLVYDAHEYFCEMEEVVNRPLIKKLWKFIERKTVPKVNAAYTVSDGYATLFYNEYKVPFEVIRNTTELRESLEIPKKEFVLYQGAVNYGRALFDVLEAIAICKKKLVICGEGDALQALQDKVKELNIEHLVSFEGFIQNEMLTKYTNEAFLGLTIFENQGLSHIHSLANRFFDYMHSATPQIAMQFPEYQNFNNKHQVAYLISDTKPATIANAINRLYEDEDLYKKLQENAKAAKKIYNWQSEERKLLSIYRKL